MNNQATCKRLGLRFAVTKITQSVQTPTFSEEYPDHLSYKRWNLDSSGIPLVQHGILIF